MPDPVVPAKNGRWPERHLRSAARDCYLIMSMFGYASNGTIQIDELVRLMSKLAKYQHLSQEALKEMLAQVASISFLFLFDVRGDLFCLKGRNYYE